MIRIRWQKIAEELASRELKRLLANPPWECKSLLQQFYHRTVFQWKNAYRSNFLAISIQDNWNNLDIATLKEEYQSMQPHPNVHGAFFVAAPIAMLTRTVATVECRQKNRGLFLFLAEERGRVENMADRYRCPQVKGRGAIGCQTGTVWRWLCSPSWNGIHPSPPPLNWSRSGFSSA